MAKPKKGALHQILVPMVDSTDFASVESAITESDFNSGVTKKFYGLNTGGSAATTSGTISKTASLVRSGVFRLTLKTTENNYDQMMVRVSKTGCAEQIFTWENVDNDDSDLMSALTVIQSMASDAASAAVVGSSRALLIQSRLSDLDSRLASDVSDVLLALTVIRSMASDAASAAVVGSSRALLIQSRLSDLDSRLVSDLSDVASAVAVGNSRVLLVQSMASDLQSKLSDVESNLLSLLTTTGVGLNASAMSDLRSAITANTVTLTASDISDIASAVAAAVTTVTASDISDIASAVRAALVSNLSDILSAAQQGNSRILVTQSMASDLQSKLSDIESNLLSLLTTTGVGLNASTLSDIRSAITANTVTLAASDISDIASAVRATLVSDLSDILSAAQQTNSRALVVQSRLSDLDSRLSSDVSDLASMVTVAQSMASDAHSAAVVGSSRALVIQSQASDIYSTVLAGVPLNASALSDVQSAALAALTSYDPPTNAEMEARTLTAALIAKLTAHLGGVLTGVVGTGSTTTSLVLNASTGINAGVPSSTNDAYNGRVIVFLTGTLANQATDITDYVGATVTMTITAVTSAPQSGDTFIVV
jgi:hypothetical protein